MNTLTIERPKLKHQQVVKTQTIPKQQKIVNTQNDTKRQKIEDHKISAYIILNQLKKDLYYLSYENKTPDILLKIEETKKKIENMEKKKISKRDRKKRYNQNIIKKQK